MLSPDNRFLVPLWFEPTWSSRIHCFVKLKTTKKKSQKIDVSQLRYTFCLNLCFKNEPYCIRANNIQFQLQLVDLRSAADSKRDYLSIQSLKCRQSGGFDLLVLENRQPVQVCSVHWLWVDTINPSALRISQGNGKSEKKRENIKLSVHHKKYRDHVYFYLNFYAFDNTSNIITWWEDEWDERFFSVGILILMLHFHYHSSFILILLIISIKGST